MQPAHPGRGTRKTRPIVRGTIILVEVSRLPAGPISRRYCGCGGPEPGRLTWICCGDPTSDASTSSTRCVSSNRAEAGRRPASSIESKPIAGLGWSPSSTCSCD
jgi:hypothetical protein